MANILYNYTDREQSERLMKAGLDARTADMQWYTERNRFTGGEYWTAKLGRSQAIRRNLYSFREGYVKPCWSFAALFAMLPVIDGGGPLLRHAKDAARGEEGEYFVGYEGARFSAWGVTMTDAAVEVVCQMMEQGWTFTEEGASHGRTD